MQFAVVYYRTEDGKEPVREFLAGLRRTNPILHTLLVRGMTKLEDGANHHRPLTELVDRRERIWELRVGRTDIVMLCGYVKQRQALDRGELERARGYKRDLERRAR